MTIRLTKALSAVDLVTKSPDTQARHYNAEDDEFEKFCPQMPA